MRRREFYKRVPILSAASVIPLGFCTAYFILPLLLFEVGNVEIIIKPLAIDVLILIFFVLWGDYEFEKYNKQRKKAEKEHMEN